MAKKNDTEPSDVVVNNAQDITNEPTTAKAALTDSALADLRDKGQVVLTATTREILFEEVEILRSQLNGQSIGCGAVGRKDDGTYDIQLNIIY